MRVLVLFAHPALERSRVHRALLTAPPRVPGVTVHDLYERYPDLHLDVEREQELLLAHDAIVFQYPFYWYQAPSILKEWQDLVLEYGWAYGRGGDRLAGKVTFNVITAGGSEQAYQPGGYNRFSVRHLLAPWEATATLCGMRYLAPFVVHGALKLTRESASPHADDYQRVLQALVDDRLDLDRAAGAERLNADLDTVVRPTPAAFGS